MAIERRRFGRTGHMSSAVLFGGAVLWSVDQGTADRVLDLLANKYKEAPVAAGVTNTGGLVEVLSTGKGDTWTIIITTPKGMSCLVAAGEAWREFEAAKLDEPHT